MKIVKPRIIIEGKELDYNKLKTIEKCARICYKSEPKGNINEKFIAGLIRSGHESVIEHEKVTVLIETDRGIANEITRHRLASYSQSSTRYINYSNDKFGKEIKVIQPLGLDFFQESTWDVLCSDAENKYFEMLKKGAKPEQARSVLPLSLQTELYVTMNFRAWRNFLKLRVDKTAHPDVRRIAIPLLITLKTTYPPLFLDIDIPSDFDTEDYAEVVIT